MMRGNPTVAKGPCLALPLLLVLLLISPTAFAQNLFATRKAATITFDGCHPDEYYSGLNSSITPSREELQVLLRETHRRQLPYTDDNGDDVWKALMDLDAGDEPDTVRLIYRQVDAPVSLKGDSEEGWNREHLWPKSRGIGLNGMDFTDIHHLRPSDSNVNAARGNKYFGDCVVGGGTCVIPATEESAADTAASRTAFLPPAVVRGDIARALFYMDVRYSGSDNDLDLRLTDCPEHEFSDVGMAYKSQLLQWHRDDLVSEEERLRNDKACERWQGNRNPFVDNPFLAEHIFGQPQQFPYDCDMDDPGEVSCVGLGAVMIIGVNSDNPDTVAMVAMEDLPPNMVLYLTDNAWLAAHGDFGHTEGIVSFRVPESGIARGTVFGFGELDFPQWQWERLEGNFLLSASGDSLILYCRDSTDGLALIAGLSYGGYWTDTKGGDSTKSALPDDLAGVAVTLIIVANYQYHGPTQGSVDAVRAAIVNSENWESHDGQRFTDMGAMSSFRLSGSSSVTSGTKASAESAGGGDSSVGYLNRAHGLASLLVVGLGLIL